MNSSINFSKRKANFNFCRFFSLLKRIFRELSSLKIEHPDSTEKLVEFFRESSVEKEVLLIFQGILFDDFPIDLFSKEMLDLLEEMIHLEELIADSTEDFGRDSIVNKNLFLSIVFEFLSNLKNLSKNQILVDFLRRILPLSRSSMKTIVVHLIDEICRNLYFVVFRWENKENFSSKNLVRFVVDSMENLRYFVDFSLSSNADPNQRWLEKVKIDRTEIRQIVFAKFPSILSCLFFVATRTSTCSKTQQKQIQHSIKKLVFTLLKSNGVQFVRALIYCWAGRQRSSTNLDFQRDHHKEIRSFIDILIQLSDSEYNISQMIDDIHQFLRDQTVRGFFFEKRNISTFFLIV